MAQMSPAELKRMFPFDQYGRYATIRDIVNTNRKEGERYRILDVGGRGNFLRHFLPADDVFYLDPHIDTEDANFIAGDGCDMPCEDGGFDFVVSADVFEHVPAAGRKQFIQENLRVAKLAVILAAPFYSPETELAERLANESYSVISQGEDHTWLQQHIAEGLPHEREVEDVLGAGGYGIQKIANNDLRLWQSLIYANFISHEVREKSQDFNEFYNEKIFPRDHGELSYRKIYFIKKDESLQDLRLAEGEIDTGLYLEAIRNNYSLLSEVYLQDKERIEALAREGRQKDLALEQKAAQLARKQTELEQKYMEVSQRTAELDRAYSSKSWQVTRPFRVLWRSVSVVRREGPVVFCRKAVGFLMRRYQPRLASRGGLNPELQLQIREWYQAHRQKVTIVIPSYNDHQLLEKCLASIAKTTDAAWVDVIVVDDASTEKAHLDYLRSISRPNVEVIFQEENGGFAKTVNAGLMAVPQGDVIVLNSDIVAQKLWLQALQFAARSDDRIGIVGPRLLYPDGKIQYAGSHRNTGSPDWVDHYYRFQPSGFPPANIPNYVIGNTGACMYIKREVIQEIGYLDEKFPMAFEDMDYCLRAWNGGYRSLYYPAAMLTHHESATRTTKQGDRELASLRYFWEKWGAWFDQRNVYNQDGKLRVIYVLQATGVGGGHRLVFEQLNRLQEIGVAVELYALEGQPEWFPLQVQVRTFESYEQLIGALAQEEAIKVATWWETAAPVWLASVNKGIPVYYVQDIETFYYQDDPHMQAVVLSRYRKEFNYITESLWNGRQLEQMGLAAEVVNCGIDADIFHRTDDAREKNVVLSLGRSNYLKNLDMTLAAWKGIEQDQPTLWMFGIEPKLATGLDNAEYFVRPSDAEVNVLYNRATVFVQSSRHEGLCLPILEAMAAGAPVICTDAHGNADFCFDGQNCLMVAQDDAAGLSAAIVRLLADEELQEKLRRAGYRTAAEYSWPVVTAQLEHFYQGLAGAPVAAPEKCL